MCSFTLGHWIIPFLSILVVRTMKCFHCPQKDASVVLWDSLSPDDQIFLWDKYPDAGQGAVCVRSARPSAFFSRHSSSTSSSAPQSVDSGLPSGPLVVSGADTMLERDNASWGRTLRCKRSEVPGTLMMVGHFVGGRERERPSKA